MSAAANSMWRPPVRLLPTQDRNRDGHGGLSDRRPDRRTGARDGRDPFYRHFSHDGVQARTWRRSTAIAARASALPWSSTTAATKLRPGSSPAISTGPPFSRAGCAGSTAAVFSPRCHPPRRAHHRGPAGGEGGRRSDVVRSQLREKLWNIIGGHDRAVTVLDRIVQHVDVLLGNEEDLQLGLGIQDRKSPRGRNSIPARFWA